MRYSRSLRFRIATAFAVMGGATSLMIAVVLYFGARDAGVRLLDETLAAEMQDYLARRARNPRSLPPATASLVGYVVPAGPGGSELPPALAKLPLKEREARLDGVPYRLLATRRDGTRYYLLHNETLLRESQSRLLLFLAAFVAGMAVVSGGFALWLTERAIEPVKELARRLRGLDPDAPMDGLADDFPRDEVGELARAFEQTLGRLAGFIERERAFTADVSHELRTPLAVIRGAAEVLLANDALADKDRQRLARIERAAADMADLATALLAMAREKDDGRGGTADMAALLEENLDKHRPLLGERPVAVRMEIAARPRVAADPNLLAIVIANLIRNSFTYTEQGEVRIRLDARCLTISDTGRGIHREALAKVFQRLYKGPTSDGAGIGLSLVKKICDRYGWEIRLGSEEGRGTEALLTFADGVPMA
jgi:signal transduction histidine kinase